MTIRTVHFDETYFRDPHTAAAELAAAGPIHRFTSPSGTRGWLITGGELAYAVLNHPDIGKSPEAMIGGPGQGHSGSVAAVRRAAGRALVSHMLGTDPPDHARLREAVAEAFTPRAVGRLAPRIAAYTAQLIDDIDPRAPVDLVAALGFPLPVRVICHILGLPDRHVRRIGRASSVLSDVIVATPDELRSAAVDFARLLIPRLALRRLRPRDDLLTEVAQQWRRRRLSPSEALSTVALLLVAGHETTSNLITNTLLALLQHPGELGRLRADPARLDAVIEETLRYDPPVPTTTLRAARRPLELAGQSIRPDEWLMVSLLAAHRDPATVSHPEQFDPGRKPNRHLAFGHGIHYCLGARLARAETRTAITQLLARYPEISLAVPADQLRWRQSVVFRRLEELPVLLR